MLEERNSGTREPAAGPGLHEGAVLFAAAAILFGAAIAYMGGLTFPFYRDEVDYWEQTLEFLAAWPPGLELLRSYGEPMTPLSFLIWGTVERWFGGGVPGMRLTNVAISFATLALIGWRTRTPEHRALLSGLVLLAFPYWVPLSIALYTDVPAVFFVVLGLWCWARGHGVASGLAFTLAIATRQYMVTFPAALLAAEALGALLDRRPLPVARLAPLAVAMLSLGGWIAFFGGLGPSDGLNVYPTHVEAIFDVTPGYGHYFLSCVAVYFVLPELALFRRSRAAFPSLRSRRSLAIGAAVALAFAVFPPPDDVALGPLNRALRFVFPPDVMGTTSHVIRSCLYAVLAWITCVRFARLDVVFWLLLSRFVLMMVVWEGWEKYNIALVASLWYLRSISPLDGPVTLWRLDAAPASER